MKKTKIVGFAFLTLLSSCGNEWREVTSIQGPRYHSKLEFPKKSFYTACDPHYLYSTDEHLLDTMMKDETFFSSKIKSRKRVSNQVYVITEDHDAYQFVDLNSTNTRDNAVYHSYWADASICYIKDGDVKSMVYFPNYFVLSEADIGNKSFSKTFVIDTAHKSENASFDSFAEFYRDLGMEIQDDKIYLDCFLGMSSESQDLQIKKKMILSVKENEFTFHLEEDKE